jgi:hypothetical protein
MAVAEYAIWESPPPIDSSSQLVLDADRDDPRLRDQLAGQSWLLRHGIKEPMMTV